MAQYRIYFCTIAANAAANYENDISADKIAANNFACGIGKSHNLYYICSENYRTIIFST